MKYSIFSAAIASLVTYVAADFHIYFESQVQDVVGEPDPATSKGVMMFDGQPSCNDVSNGVFVALVADASSATYARCKGCGDEKDVVDWDIEELEINARNWGHITLYKHRNYDIIPSDESGSIGTCERVDEDDAHQYNCAIPFLAGKGTRLFRCTSDELEGLSG